MRFPAILFIAVLAAIGGCGGPPAESVSQDVGEMTSEAASQAVQVNVPEQMKKIDPVEITPPDLDELDRIFEALFRYQFENNASGMQQQAQAYFLSLPNGDPSPEFLERFDRHVPPVKRGSEFEMGMGLKFYVSTWEMNPEGEIEIYGGYYEDMLSSTGQRYLLKKSNKRWFVISDEVEWIS